MRGVIPTSAPNYTTTIRGVKRGAASSRLRSVLRRARPVLGQEERVAVVAGRDERLLDRPRADPADQVPHRARLVVRPGSTAAAERLLADDGAGRLVVHVEVAGGVAEHFPGLLDRLAVARENGAGEPIGRGGVDELERLLPAVVRIDERGHDRPEELLLEQPRVGIVRLDHGRLDEPALGVVVPAAREHLVALRAGVLDRLALLRE